MERTIEKLKESFGYSTDVKFRKIQVGSAVVVVCYIDGFSDKILMEQCLFSPLVKVQNCEQITLSFLQQTLPYIEKIEEVKDYDEVLSIIADGDVVLLAGEKYYSLSFKSYPVRSISEPQTSMVVKGPREGFIEDMKLNTVLLRRKLRTEKFAVKYLKVGRYTKTSVAVCYINGIVNDKLVETIVEKIEKIDIDGVLDSSYIAKFLSENNYSVFKQEGTSEKPDIVASKLLEGKVAIVVDGSPIVLTYPYALIEDLQDSHDYITRSSRATMLRILRLFAVVLAVFLPCSYVVMQEFHYEIFPAKLLESVASATQSIPFTPSVEMLFIILLFEILNEASIRMPKYVGMALGVVGAIVLGDTGVKSGLISSPAVLIASISSIGMYCLPDLVGSISLLRITFILISTVTGLFGLLSAIVVTIGYVARIEIYGTPYLAPYAPNISSDLKDGVNKMDLTDMYLRPKSYNNKNKVRLKRGK